MSPTNASTDRAGTPLAMPLGDPEPYWGAAAVTFAGEGTGAQPRGASSCEGPGSGCSRVGWRSHVKAAAPVPEGFGDPTKLLQGTMPEGRRMLAAARCALLLLGCTAILQVTGESWRPRGALHPTSWGDASGSGWGAQG